MFLAHLVGICGIFMLVGMVIGGTAGFSLAMWPEEGTSAKRRILGAIIIVMSMIIGATGFVVLDKGSDMVRDAKVE